MLAKNLMIRFTRLTLTSAMSNTATLSRFGKIVVEEEKNIVDMLIDILLLVTNSVLLE